MHVNLHSLSYAAYVIIFIVGYSFSQVWSCRAAVAYIILRNISKELTQKLLDMLSFLQLDCKAVWDPCSFLVIQILNPLF